MLQCVAVCCSVLQCVAVRCSALQCVAMCHSTTRERPTLSYVHDQNEPCTHMEESWPACIFQRAKTEKNVRQITRPKKHIKFCSVPISVISIRPLYMFFLCVSFFLWICCLVVPGVDDSGEGISSMQGFVGTFPSLSLPTSLSLPPSLLRALSPCLSLFSLPASTKSLRHRGISSMQGPGGRGREGGRGRGNGGF